MLTNTSSELTRERILKTAFNEFYTNGYQGGSLNRIIADAHVAKGALFHHFRGKKDLAYHVVDEVIRPFFQKKWIGPLLHSKDPISDIKRILLTTLKDDHEMLCKGCPLNNLAQEMSPLDEDFRNRLNLIYQEWRDCIEQAFRRGIEQGAVRKEASPKQVAAFIVSALAGMVGTAKTAQSLELLTSSAEGMFGYLESLKP